MTRKVLLLQSMGLLMGFLATQLLHSSVYGYEEYGHQLIGPARCCPPSLYCPDDYCRKLLPNVPCPAYRCHTDCFVRRPLPCPPQNKEWVTCDDFARKCLPPEPCGFRPDPCSNNVISKGQWSQSSFIERTAALIRSKK